MNIKGKALRVFAELSLSIQTIIAWNCSIPSLGKEEEGL